MIYCQYCDGKKHGCGLEDIQWPLMLEGIAFNTKREFDNAVYGSYLQDREPISYYSSKIKPPTIQERLRHLTYFNEYGRNENAS
jgi:hypothetical protein